MKKIKTCTLLVLVSLILSACSYTSNQPVTKATNPVAKIEQITSVAFSVDDFTKNPDVIALKAEKEKRTILLRNIYNNLQIKKGEDKMVAYRRAVTDNDELKASMIVARNHIRGIIKAFPSLRNLSKSELAAFFSGNETKNSPYKKVSNIKSFRAPCDNLTDPVAWCSCMWVYEEGKLWNDWMAANAQAELDYIDYVQYCDINYQPLTPGHTDCIRVAEAQREAALYQAMFDYNEAIMWIWIPGC